MIKTTESDICLIRILIYNIDDKTQTLQLINIYNSCLLFFTFIKKSSIISCLNVRIMFKWYNQWRSELIVLDL